MLLFKNWLSFPNTYRHLGGFPGDAGGHNITILTEERRQPSQVFLLIVDEMFGSSLHARSLHTSNLTSSQYGRKVSIRRPVSSKLELR